MVLLLAKMLGHCALVHMVALILDEGLVWVMLRCGLLLFCVSGLTVVACCLIVVCCTGCRFHCGGRPSRSSFIFKVICCCRQTRDSQWHVGLMCAYVMRVACSTPTRVDTRLCRYLP